MVKSLIQLLKDYNNMIVNEIDDLYQATQMDSIYLIYGIVKSCNPSSMIISLKTEDMVLLAEKPIPKVNSGTLSRIYFQKREDGAWLLIAFTALRTEELQKLQKLKKLEVEING